MDNQTPVPPESSVPARSLGRVLRLAFGSFRWTPPPWAQRVGRASASAARMGAGWLARNRGLALGLAAGVLVLAVGGTAAWRWYESRPRPVRFSVSGSPPAPMAMADDARPNPLRIVFGGSAARLEQVGKAVGQGITLKPALGGEWRWASDSTLEFKPAAEWAIGQEYVVAFERTLFPDHVLLEEYEYRFQTAPFTAQLTAASFYQDPTNPKDKRVEVTVSFSHPVDTAQFPRHVELALQQRQGMLLGKKETWPFTVTYDKFKGLAFLHSHPIPIPPDDATMQVQVAPGARAAAGGPAFEGTLSTSVTVPGMFSYFHVDSALLTLARNARYEPEQVLVVNLSGGATEQELRQNLKVFLLPRDKPAMQGRPAQKNYGWYGTHDIGPEVLAQATPVALEAIPTDREYATLHSFKYKAEVGRSLYVRVLKGTQAFGGYVLAKDWDTVAQVPPFPKELAILQEGSLLALSGEKKVSILARDVETVRFTVGRVLPGQLNHLISQTHGRLDRPSFNYSFGEDSIVERFSEVRSFEKQDPGKAQYASFDLAPYLTATAAGTLAPAGDARRGLFFFRVESWDPSRNHVNGPTDRRFLLVTDLGLLVKDNADGSHDAFVQSLPTGEPAAGAQVQVLGKNGLPVFTVEADAQGHAKLPKLTDFREEKAPVAYVARRADDLAFLPFNRHDRRLNFSRFDVGGLTGASAGDRLDAFLFSDRGLYRPGDLFHAGYIVRPTDWKSSLEGIPLEAVITDARGLEVSKQKLALDASGFGEVQYQTEETSPTGVWQVSLYIVKDERRASLLGSTPIKVEEFLPDRMKIAVNLSEERLEGWVKPEGLQGRVTLQNLFGTPAANRRVAANLTLSPAQPFFRPWRDYAFFDPTSQKKVSQYDERLADVQTDEEGRAEFPLGLERFERATVRVSVLAEGFEAEGGRGVSAEATTLVSPLDYLLGYKADGDLHYVHQNSERALEVIAVDPTLKKVAVSGLKAKVVEQRYVSVLTQQPNGTYQYQSQLKEVTVSEAAMAVPEKGLRWKLPTAQPGTFVLSVRDPQDLEIARIPFTVAGSANLTRSLEKNAELEVALARADAAPGETLELQITAPYTGSGLITIERDRVYAWKWFKTTTTSTVQTIEVPRALEGNGYVNVTFLRALDSPEIFMSPLSYAVAPFSVSRAGRTIEVSVDSPDLARPGEPYRMKYRGSKRGKAVIFAVDEGILQVAGYATPDPLAHFFRKRALEVETAQILDLLLPEFSVAQRLSASGGDAGQELIGKNLNPFRRKTEKPVAYWSGLVDIGPEERELRYDVPDSFHGTLRVMAVAVSPEALGAFSKRATIRGPFVLSPNAPTFVAPGDEFSVSVGLSNNVEGSGAKPSIALAVEPSEALEVLDGKARTLTVAEGREGVATFRVRARPHLGNASLTFTAGLGEKKGRQAATLSVRPAVPFLTTVGGGFLKSGTKEVPVARRMHAEYRTLETSVSPLPLGLARGLLAYLDKFPYGCTEQLVSKSFPALVLRDRQEFGFAPRTVEESLAATVRILRARQNAEGAFGMWAANSHADEFQTLYALHFLTEAKERGYPVPPDLLGATLEWTKGYAQRLPHSLHEARARAYGLYLLTRNGTMTGDLVATLRGQLDGALKDAWKKDLAAVYLAGTYKLLKQEKAAARLLDETRLGAPQQADYAFFYDGLVYDAQLLYVLSRHFPEATGRVGGAGLEGIAQRIVGGSFNTLSSSYAILGLDAYAKAVGEAPGAVRADLSEVPEKAPARTLALPDGLFPRAAFSDAASRIRLVNRGEVGLFYQVTQAGFDVAMPTKPLKERLEVQREFRNLGGEVIEQLQIGSEMEVHLKVRALGGGQVAHVAVVDLLPGGFEVVMTPPPQQEEVPDDAGDAVEGGEVEHGDGEGEGEAYAEGDAPVEESGAEPATGRPGSLGAIGTEKSTWYPEYVDVREDRVVLYGAVGSEVREFVYKVKATNEGVFVTPPPFGESMYDRAVQARGLAGTVRVTGR